jgi:peroxiredoxin
MSRLSLPVCCLGLFTTMLLAAEPPREGGHAPDFELKALDGTAVRLSDKVAAGPTVVVMLRGYPGYQCPVCRRQVGQLAEKAGSFREAGASVVLVYPGDVPDLAEKAREFFGSKPLPEGFVAVTDPGYALTNSWGLRWEAERETAYPSTFVLGPDRVVKFARISMSHGGRTSPDEVLAAITK